MLLLGKRSAEERLAEYLIGLFQTLCQPELFGYSIPLEHVSPGYRQLPRSWEETVIRTLRRFLRKMDSSPPIAATFV